MGSDDMWLLSFHSPECFACEDFVPQLQDVAGSVAQWGIRVGAVDCTEHKRVCEDVNVVTVPAFKVSLTNGAGGARCNLQSHDGACFA